MLNILNLKIRGVKPISETNKVHSQGNEIGRVKDYSPATIEWKNSIYCYNKNTAKSLPCVDKAVFSLLKSYFYLYSKKLEDKLKYPRLQLRVRRLSVNRMFVSRPEFKHTVDKVTITVYIYNRQKTYYLNKLEIFLSGMNIFFKPGVFIRKFKRIKRKMMKIANIVARYKNSVENRFILKKKLNNYTTFENKYKKHYILKRLHGEILYMHYKQLLFLNMSKFNNSFVLPLKLLLEKIYKKRVELNLVNLKYLHFNSDIYSEIIRMKLRIRENKPIAVLQASLANLNLATARTLSFNDETHRYRGILQNIKLSDIVNKQHSLVFKPNFKINLEHQDNIDLILVKIFPYFKNDADNLKDDAENFPQFPHLYFSCLQQHVLNYIKHKSLTGIRIIVSGRLTWRRTAARAVSKLKTIGNTQNMDSRLRGISTILLRGHQRPNLQYTNFNHKTRIGAYGVKGWVSSN